MTKRTTRGEERLPVTAEVGGEGGSFADPTAQRATEEGHLESVDRDGANQAAIGSVAGAVEPEADKDPGES